MDYAHFAARLGWTPDQYRSLTRVERLFVLKALESREVEESSLLETAFELAIGNAMRKKGKRRVELWRKLRKAKVPPPVPVDEFKAIRNHFRALKGLKPV